MNRGDIRGPRRRHSRLCHSASQRIDRGDIRAIPWCAIILRGWIAVPSASLAFLSSHPRYMECINELTLALRQGGTYNRARFNVHEITQRSDYQPLEAVARWLSSTLAGGRLAIIALHPGRLFSIWAKPFYLRSRN